MRALHTALDLGCNFIDTATGTGGASASLRVLRERDGDKVYVATKIPPAPGAWQPTPYDAIKDRYPKTYLRERLERSLRDLETDCLDLLQLHTWTRAWNRDPVALETLRRFQ